MFLCWSPSLAAAGSVEGWVGGSREVAGQAPLELAPFSSVALHNCRIVWFSAPLEKHSTLGQSAFCV